MACRTSRERVYQAIGYEAGGLLLATPLCVWLTGTSIGTSALLAVVLSVATACWPPLFNTIFDAVEWRRFGHVASDRSARMRLVHALALEASDCVVTVPILMVMGGLSLVEALAADLGLTVVWVAYGYLYHLAFDRLRPVRK